MDIYITLRGKPIDQSVAESLLVCYRARAIHLVLLSILEVQQYQGRWRQACVERCAIGHAPHEDDTKTCQLQESNQPALRRVHAQRCARLAVLVATIMAACMSFRLLSSAASVLVACVLSHLGCILIVSDTDRVCVTIVSRLSNHRSYLGKRDRETPASSVPGLTL